MNFVNYFHTFFFSCDMQHTYYYHLLHVWRLWLCFYYEINYLLYSSLFSYIVQNQLSYEYVWLINGLILHKTISIWAKRAKISRHQNIPYTVYAEKVAACRSSNHSHMFSQCVFHVGLSRLHVYTIRANRNDTVYT